MKKFRVQLNEEELEALINHHSHRMLINAEIERSKRIHDLTKKLKNDGPETSNDPRPAETERMPINHEDVSDRKDIW